MKAIINLYSEKKVSVPEGMTGLFFEDINYAADGGLNAQMLENPNFEFLHSQAGQNKGDYYTEYEGLYGWKVLDSAELKIVSGSCIAEENPHYLRFISKKSGDGFTNKAFDGITIEEGKEYAVSFYARNLFCPEQINSVTVSVESESGEIYGSEKFSLEKNTKDEICRWKKYSGILKAKKSIRHGKFTVKVSDAGTVEFDFFSMIPCDAVCGIFRKDLVEKLQNIKPGFLRFPGGCIVEGSTLQNRYDFKNTLKPLEHRKSNWSRWAVHRSWQPHEENDGPEVYPYYNQTYGIGFYEFFLLCEYLKCRPLPVLNVGLACQFQSFEMVDVDSEEFSKYVQDALDLIEFANGSTDSIWGKVRADLGHPSPFNLELLGIGNEQWQTKDNRFFERYTAFERAVHKKYPEIKLIASAGPNVEWKEFNEAWNFFRGSCSENPDFAYAVDEHYYMPPKWFLDHADFYDAYDRQVKVFAGEYAAHEEGGGAMNRPRLNTLECAVNEGAFMTGVERNADVVVLASYAPLFARKNYAQWSPDMIWFDDKSCYASPSYYVQLMFGNYTGNISLDTKGQHSDLYKKGLYYNPTLDEKSGTVYLKIANTNDEDIELEINEDSGFKSMEWVYIGGLEKSDCNSFEEPEKIRLKEIKSSFTGKVTLVKNSFNVLILK